MSDNEEEPKIQKQNEENKDLPVTEQQVLQQDPYIVSANMVKVIEQIQNDLKLIGSYFDQIYADLIKVENIRYTASNFPRTELSNVLAGKSWQYTDKKGKKKSGEKPSLSALRGIIKEAAGEDEDKLKKFRRLPSYQIIYTMVKSYTSLNRLKTYAFRTKQQFLGSQQEQFFTDFDKYSGRMVIKRMKAIKKRLASKDISIEGLDIKGIVTKYFTDIISKNKDQISTVRFKSIANNLNKTFGSTINVA